MSFAIGVSMAMSSLSKTLSRATVVPIAEATGTYIGALWYTCSTCLFSTLVGLILIVLSDEPQEAFAKKQHERNKAHLRWSQKSSLRASSQSVLNPSSPGAAMPQRPPSLWERASSFFSPGGGGQSTSGGSAFHFGGGGRSASHLTSAALEDASGSSYQRPRSSSRHSHTSPSGYNPNSPQHTHKLSVVDENGEL